MKYKTANKIKLTPFKTTQKIISKSTFCKLLGKFYVENENFYNAIETYKEAIRLDFNNYDNWFYLALSLKNNGQIDDAIIAYKRAIELKPDAISAYRNLGNIYFTIKNDPYATIECCEKVVEHKSLDAAGKTCLSVAYLKTKNFEQGWKVFEERVNKEIIVAARSLIPNSKIKIKPLWRGEDISEKTIYVYYEGGYGDTIMFSRYLPILAKRCKKVFLKVQRNNVELFKDSEMQNVEILDIDKSEASLDYDVHTPIMSLPNLLKSYSEKDIPFKDKYLKCNPQKVKLFKSKYFDHEKFKIGIKWQGNTAYDTKRVLSPESFYPMLNVKNTKFYSLQINENGEETPILDSRITDVAPALTNFSDTAAMIQNLDLVICNDTSVAHVAGALGKPCWVLLPYVQDWRWTTDLSYCIWYDSVKLFKQSQPDNWEDVLEAVQAELEKFVKPESPVLVS